MSIARFLRVSAHLHMLPVLEGGEETLIGGQAVMEGVMMRAPHSYCVAVRKPGGEIVTEEQPIARMSEKYRIFRWPILRGLGTLGQAMTLGVRALKFSANAALDEGSTESGKKLEISSGMMGLNLLFSLAGFLFLYKFIPLFLATRLGHVMPSLSSRFATNMMDGVIRLSIFMGFLFLLSRLKDIKRVFEYHGAEHKVVFNYESGKPVNVENAQEFSTFHPRCGTNFMFVVIAMSMILYALLPIDGFWPRLIARIAILPLIVGVSYELIRFAARRQGSLIGILFQPGLWMQRITTKPPDDSQASVAIQALSGAMELEARQGGELVVAPKMQFQRRLDESERRFDSLTSQMADPAVINDSTQYRKIAKARNDLEETVSKYREWKSAEQHSEEARLMLNEADPELRAMAQEEIASLEPQLARLEEELKLLLLPKDPNDEKNVVLEIRAGTGGDEATLFAAEIFRMYGRFAETRGWNVEVTASSESPVGGLKEVIALISGKKVFSQLKYESGVHRVQRVPATEQQGRVHTSAITVAVLPEADEVEIVIDPKDVRKDTFCSSGPGGQSVNTTYSAIRLTHLPTGLVVSCQDEKSQIKNLAKAMRVLRSRLYEMELEKQREKIGAERRTMVGSGDRSEKIRTYNFPQNRVTDHRIGLTLHQLDQVMEGKLDPIVDALTTYYQTEKLKEQGEAA